MGIAVRVWQRPPQLPVVAEAFRRLVAVGVRRPLDGMGGVRQGSRVAAGPAPRARRGFGDFNGSLPPLFWTPGMAVRFHGDRGPPGSACPAPAVFLVTSRGIGHRRRGQYHLARADHAASPCGLRLTSLIVAGPVWPMPWSPDPFTREEVGRGPFGHP